MIISHKYKYIFIQVPHTASTAISRELSESYDGVSILHKHAHYNEFLKIANAEEKTYFVFAGIRNPLDEAVSMYFKYKTNHRGNFTDPRKLQQNGGFVTEAHLRRFNFIKNSDADFPAYFKEFFHSPYDNAFSWTYDKIDSIIRFESLQDDFATTLKLMGIEQKRPLPLFNKTADKRDQFLSYYLPEINQQAKYVFGPFMKRFGYDFPAGWGDDSVNWLSQVEFQALNTAGKFFSNQLRWEPDRWHRLYRQLRRFFGILRKVQSRLTVKYS